MAFTCFGAELVSPRQFCTSLELPTVRNCPFRPLFDRMLPDGYDRCAGWSSLVARWAHNPKVGGSNPPPATKQVPDYKRLPSQPEGVSVVLAHNLLTEFQPRISHLHDPPFCLARRQRTKQVVELLHQPHAIRLDRTAGVRVRKRPEVPS